MTAILDHIAEDETETAVENSALCTLNSALATFPRDHSQARAAGLDPVRPPHTPDLNPNLNLSLSCPAMVPEENSGQAENNTPRRELAAHLHIVNEGSSALALGDSRLVVPHETTPDTASHSHDEGRGSNAGDSVKGLSQDTSAPAAPSSESSSLRLGAKLTLWHNYQQLLAQGLSQNQAAAQLGVSGASLSRMTAAVRATGGDLAKALADKYHNSGRTPRTTLTAAEEQQLQAIYLATDRTAKDGSMRAACRLFALDPQTREELRTIFLAADEKGLLPGIGLKALRKVTRAHFAAHRKPGMLSTTHFSNRIGAFLGDKLKRLRIIESDDATLNFPAWIPWQMGGDPISDKYGVRLGRWQFLPALEAGWSQHYLGYVLACRPRGSYTQDDVRAVINLVVTQHGLPDAFRFERGTWESNSVLDLLKSLGIDLQTVWQSNQKPHIEGGFNSLWTYLSLVPGHVGRFRGEFEQTTTQLMQCQAGRLDPREVFPSLKEVTAALDGAIALRNADKRHSKTYGDWIPEVRFREHAQATPWRSLDPALQYLFAPIVREWTVAKGIVGNNVTLADGLSVPFHFFHPELYRSNGQKVRVYFDPAAPTVTATIVALTEHLCFKPGQIICQAQLHGDVPHFTRAALGWQPASETPSAPNMRGPLSALRREVRALAPGGRVTAASTEQIDNRGNVTRIERSAKNANGVSEVSPGLRGTSYPGSESRIRSNPVGVAASPVETEDLSPVPTRSISPLIHTEDISLRRPATPAAIETETL